MLPRPAINISRNGDQMRAPHACRQYKRERIGPTGRRRRWMILVDRCVCGRLLPVHTMTWEQFTWLRRLMRASGID